MKTTSTRRFEFSAAHTMTSNAICGERTHGHDFWLKVSTENRPESWTKVADIVFELASRDLNKMIIGNEPTPEGIAAWTLERLRPHLPGLTAVAVGFRGYEAIVEV